MGRKPQGLEKTCGSLDIRTVVRLRKGNVMISSCANKNAHKQKIERVETLLTSSMRFLESSPKSGLAASRCCCECVPIYDVLISLALFML